MAGAAVWAFGNAEISASEKKDDRPNVLFIMTDQQFSDAMSNRIGTEYINTPAMDSLAEHGMNFDRAYCANPICVPSRCSMFTGLYPHQTGVQHNSKTPSFDYKYQCMGKLFRDAGYDTGYVGKWHMNFSEKNSEAHGFDFLATIKGDGNKPEPAIKFLTQKRDKPFLFVFSLMNPHNICQWARGEALPDGAIGDPPAPADCPPKKDNRLPPKNECDIMTLMRKAYHNSRTFPVGDFDDDKWRQYIWAYYRMIEMVDGVMGKVLDALRESGQEENTLVIFVSDHGDCHGAHRFNQKTVFYDEAARVPCIVSFKGITKKGTSDKLVNTGIDLIPTMCDFAGIDIPKDLPGASLKQIAEGKNVSSWRKYTVVSNYMAQGAPVDGVTPSVKGRMVRSEDYKYCVYSQGKQRESLVDMKKDPGEKVNLATNPSYETVLKHHRNMLHQHAERYGDKLALELLDPAYESPPFG